MKPPKCRLCGFEHWPREPHVWKREGIQKLCDIPAELGRPQKLEVKRGRVIAKCEHGDMIVPSVPVGPAPKWDRTAYQRDYMRKRRAAKRAHSPPQ